MLKQLCSLLFWPASSYHRVRWGGGGGGGCIHPLSSLILYIIHASSCHTSSVPACIIFCCCVVQVASCRAANYRSWFPLVRHSIPCSHYPRRRAEGRRRERCRRERQSPDPRRTSVGSGRPVRRGVVKMCNRHSCALSITYFSIQQERARRGAEARPSTRHTLDLVGTPTSDWSHGA